MPCRVSSGQVPQTYKMAEERKDKRKAVRRKSKRKKGEITSSSSSSSSSFVRCVGSQIKTKGRELRLSLSLSSLSLSLKHGGKVCRDEKTFLRRREEAEPRRAASRLLRK